MTNSPPIMRIPATHTSLLQRVARTLVVTLPLVALGAGTVVAQGLGDPAGAPRVSLGVTGFNAFRFEFLGGAEAQPSLPMAAPADAGRALGTLLSPQFMPVAPAPAAAPAARVDWNWNLGATVADAAVQPNLEQTWQQPRDRGAAASFTSNGATVGGHWRTSTLRASEAGPAGRLTFLGIGAAYDAGALEFGATWDRVVTEQLRSAWGGGPLELGTRWNLGVNYDVTADKRLTVDYAQAHLRDPGDAATDNEAKSLDARLLWKLNAGLQMNFGYQNYRYTQNGKQSDQQKTANTLQVQTRVNF